MRQNVHACFTVTRSKVRNLPEVTSRLILNWAEHGKFFDDPTSYHSFTLMHVIV